MLPWKECEFYMGQYQLSSCVNLADMYCVSYLFKKNPQRNTQTKPSAPSLSTCKLTKQKVHLIGFSKRSNGSSFLTSKSQINIIMYFHFILCTMQFE